MLLISIHLQFKKPAISRLDVPRRRAATCTALELIENLSARPGRAKNSALRRQTCMWTGDQHEPQETVKLGRSTANNCSSTDRHRPASTHPSQAAQRLTTMSTASSLGLGRYTHHLPLAVTTLASFFGVFIAAQGIRGILTPTDYAPGFGLPAPNAPLYISAGDDPASRASPPPHNDWRTNPWVLLTGARNLSFGVGLLAFRAQGDIRAMGTLLMTGLIVSLSDAYATWYTGRRDMGRSHLYGSAVCAGMGAYLLSLTGTGMGRAAPRVVGY